MGLNKTNTKVPYTHLQGRRQTLKDRHQQEKTRAREESIQYDSSMKMLNSAVMEIRKEKDHFEKNKYKYEQGSTTKVGREKDGVLILSKQDISRIKGQRKERPQFGKFKGKQGGKGKKGGQGRKGGKGRR
jgi:hypothetical protein